MKETSMGKSCGRNGLVRGGLALGIAGALACGMLPASALAVDDGSAASAQISVADVAGGLVAGHTYQVPVTFLQHGQTSSSMAATYFYGTGTIGVGSDGMMTVLFRTNATDYITKIAYNGTELPMSSDGTFSLTVPVASGDAVYPVEMTIQPMVNMGMGAVTTDLSVSVSQAVDQTPSASVSKTDLESALAAARAVEQGSKTDDAFATLQSAIESAQAVDDDSSATQDAVDQAAATLRAAVDAFNASADAESPADTPQLEEGRSYQVPVSFVRSDGQPSSATRTAKDSAVVTKKNGTYEVTIAFRQAEGNEYGSAQFNGQETVKATDADGNTTFTGTVDDPTQPVAVSLTLETAGYELTPTVTMSLDLASAQLISDDSGNSDSGEQSGSGDPSATDPSAAASTGEQDSASASGDSANGAGGSTANTTGGAGAASVASVGSSKSAGTTAAASSLPKTGDEVAVGAIAGAAAAAAAAAAVSRRRRAAREPRA